MSTMPDVLYEINFPGTYSRFIKVHIEREREILTLTSPIVPHTQIRAISNFNLIVFQKLISFEESTIWTKVYI